VSSPLDHIHPHEHGHTHGLVDASIKRSRAGVRAVLLSFLVLGLTALAQVAIFLATSSVALLADLVHNFGDALTAVPLGTAFFLRSFRGEKLAGLAVVLAIFISACVALYETIQRFLHPEDLTHLWVLAAAGLIGFAGNELAAQVRLRAGRRLSSPALIADGNHARTDGFTSLAVLLGAGGVALGLPWADPVVGLLITVAILGVLRSAVKQVGARLMDAVDPIIVDQATTAISSVEGVRQIRELRIRWIGHTLRAEVDVTADPTLSITQAHDLAHHAEDHLLTDVRRLTAATVHVSPAGVHHG